MKQEKPYLRIGTLYLKRSRKPLASGDVVSTLTPWSAECIRIDHGRDALKDLVDCYDGFCFVPSHLNFQQKIEGYFNRYQPFNHSPEPGEPKNIFKFLSIFSESRSTWVTTISKSCLNSPRKYCRSYAWSVLKGRPAKRPSFTS